MTAKKAKPGGRTTPPKEAAQEPSLLTVDLNTLTLRDLKLIEDVAGADDFQTLLEGRPSVSCLVGIAYMMRRKTDPDFTVEQAWDLPLEQIQGVSAEPDPTE